MTADILIVAHNTRDDLAACLTSLLASGATPEQIHIADNASEDGTRELLRKDFARIRVACFHHNRLYAPAVNYLIDTTRSPYLLLLNPDVECDYTQLIGLCHQFKADPRLAAIAPQLRYPDGRIQPSCRRLPDAWTPWREAWSRIRCRPSQWKMSDFNHRTSRDVPQPMFSCIWLRRSALAKIGALNEQYPLFFNDVDWCRTALAAGYRIRFDATVAATHSHGGTTSRYPLRKLWHAHRSFARYVQSNTAGRWIAATGVAGVWLTFLIRLAGTRLGHAKP